MNDLYSQALHAKQCGQHGIAIKLFQQILDNDEITQVFELEFVLRSILITFWQLHFLGQQIYWTSTTIHAEILLLQKFSRITWITRITSICIEIFSIGMLIVCVCVCDFFVVSLSLYQILFPLNISLGNRYGWQWCIFFE